MAYTAIEDVRESRLTYEQLPGLSSMLKSVLLRLAACRCLGKDLSFFELSSRNVD